MPEHMSLVTIADTRSRMALSKIDSQTLKAPCMLEDTEPTAPEPRPPKAPRPPPKPPLPAGIGGGAGTPGGAPLPPPNRPPLMPPMQSIATHGTIVNYAES